MRPATRKRRRSRRPLRLVERLPAWLAALALLVGLAAGIAAVLAGAGTRWDWWPFTTGFEVLRWGTFLGIGTLVLALVAGGTAAAWRRHALAPALLAFALGLVVVIPPLTMLQQARSVPPIHDITTDTADPPRFVALRAARRAAPNAVDYPGERAARRQRAAYPAVRPLTVAAPPERVFEAARAAADAMGWRVVAADPQAWRLEATATTFWFGFTDDVVVRLTPQDGGTRVDVRSASRVGLSDLGANARRITAFLQTLRARLGL